MTTKTTGELMKELENKSAFWLVWSIVWRYSIVAFCIGVIYGVITL